MSIRTLALVALASVSMASIVGVAHAQKVYVVNDAAVMRGTKLGKALAANISSVANQGVEQLGLKALSDQIETERKALEPILGSLTPEAREAKVKADPALKAKVESMAKKQLELQQKQNSLNNALGNTNDVYETSFSLALGPAVDFVAKEAGADIVLPLSTTYYNKPAMDLTPKVIARIDATVPTIEKLNELIKTREDALKARQATSGAAPAAPPATAPAKPPG